MIRKAAIVSISGPTLTKKEIIIIKKEKPWGIILFKRNISTEKQLVNLIKKIKKIMNDKKYPILIDEEGGRVSRLSNFLNNSLYNQKYFGDIYQKNKDIGTKLLKLYVDSLSNVLRKVGININTSPVLDLMKKKTHQVIGNWSYSSNPFITNELGKLCVKFYKKKKIATVIKHIPGHGGANSDSHFKLPKVKDTHEALKKSDFRCFKNTSSFFAMTAHIIYTNIDKSNTATHSKKIIELIRNNIKFKNIIMSDDISMKSLKGSIEDNTLKAFDAGCDLVLHCNGNYEEMTEVATNSPQVSKFIIKKTSQFYKIIS